MSTPGTSLPVPKLSEPWSSFPGAQVAGLAPGRNNVEGGAALPNKPCPYLEINREGALDCARCRNAQNWAFRGWTKGKLLAKLAAEESFFSCYLLIVYL